MHNAPSVTYPVGRSSSVWALVLGIWSVGLVLALSAASHSGVSRWSLLTLLAGCIVTGLFAVWGWSAAQRGQLIWDGRDWIWEGQGAPESESGRPEVVLDVQALLLLRWHGQGPSRWLWLERSKHPTKWSDVRRAVYSRARSLVQQPDDVGTSGP